MSAKAVRRWLRGLVGAAVGGAANSVTVMIVDPANFNLSDFRKLGVFALVSTVISLALYLRQSPVPPDEDSEIAPREWKDAE